MPFYIRDLPRASSSPSWCNNQFIRSYKDMILSFVLGSKHCNPYSCQLLELEWIHFLDK